MRSRIRRTTVVGTLAGLTLVLAGPFAASANASGHHGTSGHETGRHGWHSSQNPAEHTAQKALKAAIKAANAQLRASSQLARSNFRNDPTVMAAVALRKSVVGTATDPALILAANDAFASSVAGAVATRDAALEAAATVWFTAVDLAYTAYDTATTTPAEAAARATFRTSVRTAAIAFRVSVKTARTDFRTATASAHATLRAAVNLAEANFLLTGKNPADVDALKLAIHTARDAFKADGAVVAAKAAKLAAVTTARTTYKAAITAARDLFFSQTGHNPARIRAILPRV